MKELEYWYDFSCPYAYLASTQIEALAKKVGARVTYQPFLLGGVFRARSPEQATVIRMGPARERMNQLDMRRWAKHWGVPLNMPASHPNRTVLALRAVLAAGPQHVKSASHALFRAYWGQGRDVSQPEVVQAALDDAGLDGAALVAQASEQVVKDELRCRTDEAIERGIFGAPTFFFEGNMFWGQDRFEQLARALGLAGYDERPASQAGGEVSFWFDYSSPFAYFGAAGIEALARETGAKVRYQPFLLGALFRNIGTANVPLLSFNDAKQRYLRVEMQRFAEEHGVPFSFPTRFPMRSVLPLRLTLAVQAQKPEAVPRLVRSIFEAYWGHDQDISAPDVLGEICSREGLDPALVQQAQTDSELKAQLRALTSQAKARGLCGAPSYEVGDLVFWGQDRLGFVRRALAGWRPEGD